MPEQVEKAKAGEFIVSEATRSRSRDNVIYAASQSIAVGALIAAVLVGATATATAASGNTGNGAMGAITVDADAKRGVYVLTVIEPASNGGVFSLTDPDGEACPTGKIAVAYDGPLNFTLADGATDFAAGDTFEIEVVADPEASQTVAWAVGMDAIGLAFDAVETGAGETKPGVAITGDAEVNGHLLAYPEGSTLSDKVEARAQLRRLGIKVR